MAMPRNHLLSEYPDEELARLTLREADILRQRVTKTRRQVGDLHHISSSNVARLEKGAIEKIRQNRIRSIKLDYLPRRVMTFGGVP